MVFTGPVFAPLFINGQWTYVVNSIGRFPKLIQVPTHFFKVIIGRRRRSSSRHADEYLVGAFMVPNVSGIDKQVFWSTVHPISYYHKSYNHMYQSHINLLDFNRHRYRNLL